MDITLAPGKYITAVSGGVDSVVLLHLLRAQPGVKLVVAHYDHGIRPDSAEDRHFVQALAKSYGLPFVYDRGDLGAGASEAAARKARYGFLHGARVAAGAGAVVTAHHQDDVLETAVLNIIRGTGRRGLTSLKSTDIVKRPLLHVPKSNIVRYARDNQLLWREDSTNTDTKYKRNHVRLKLLPRFSLADREKLHGIIAGIRLQNAELDALIAEVLAGMLQDGVMDRQRFIMLPHAAAREIMAAWLRAAHIGEIDRKLLEQLVRAAKTFPAGRRCSINHNYYLHVGKNDLALLRAER